MIGVELEGEAKLYRGLGKFERAVKRGVYSSINKAITPGRQMIVQRIASTTGISPKAVRGRLPVKRAGFKRANAFMSPSSYGVPIEEYTYKARRLPGARGRTRAQILVNWVGGQTKVAAGFINPSGMREAALRTRTHKGELPKPESAMGPSVAAAFKAAPKQGILETVVDVFLGKASEDIPRQISRVFF